MVCETFLLHSAGFDPDQGTITLMMKNVTPADEGFYVCRAENTEGYATTSAHLVVKGNVCTNLIQSKFDFL